MPHSPEDRRFHNAYVELMQAGINPVGTRLTDFEVTAIARLMAASSALQMAAFAISYRQHGNRVRLMQDAVDDIQLAHVALNPPPEFRNG